MYHSITFGDKNTWDDWKLVSQERPSFQPPEARTNFITIPGSNGALDISEALTGYPLYDRRKGSFEFIVLNDYTPWQARYTEIANYLHNRKLKAVLEDDPNFYYEGRFFMTKWQSGTQGDWSKVTIEYDVHPYKKDIVAVDEAWLWDPFSFVDGVISTAIYSDIVVTPEGTERDLEQRLYGEEPVCPDIIASEDGIEVRYISEALNVDITRTLKVGRNRIPEIVLTGERVKFIFTGTGTVSVSFHKGKL